jgi:hypothetical protein
MSSMLRTLILMEMCVLVPPQQRNHHQTLTLSPTNFLRNLTVHQPSPSWQLTWRVCRISRVVLLRFVVLQCLWISVSHVSNLLLYWTVCIWRACSTCPVFSTLYWDFRSCMYGFFSCKSMCWPMSMERACQQLATTTEIAGTGVDNEDLAGYWACSCEQAALECCGGLLSFSIMFCELTVVYKSVYVSQILFW